MVISLVASRDYYESVLGSADVGLLATDRHAQVIGANARAAEILALGTDELVGRPLGEVLAREPRLLEFVGALLRGDAGPLAEEVPVHGGPLSGGRLVAALGSRLLRAAPDGHHPVPVGHHGLPGAGGSSAKRATGRPREKPPVSCMKSGTRWPP
jgi:PAS domain-containing protein